MTREHKLALIVGFSLVLVLGVLISDHFSKSRAVESSEELRPAEAKNVGAVPPGIRLVSDTVPSTLHLPGQPRQEFGTSLPTQPLPQMNPQGATPPPQAATFEMVNDGSTSRSGIPAELAQKTQLVPSPGLDTVPGSNQPVIPGNTAVLGPNNPTSLPVSTGQMRRHDIKEGESLYALTKSTYGDGKLWEKLRDFNKGKIGADGAVREGVTIVLPPKDVLLGKAAMPDAKTAAAAPPQGSSAPVGRDSKPNTQTKTDGKPEVKPVRSDTRVASMTSGSGAVGGAGYTTYTVQKGDALEDVAKRLLGSPKRWPEIVEANKSVISDPESIQVGMQLRIPSR